MSALNDNKAFLSGVLTGESLNFDTSVFGLWVSIFQNVNYSENGYSYFQPLATDITAIDFPITGKRFSLFNFDGKYSDARFIISSGKKGDAEYDTTVPIADISNSFVSGFKPLIIMPNVDFTGSIYRRTEITGYRNSVIGNYQTLGLSGEDWQKTSIPVNVSDDVKEYAYFDTGYSGYSNEVATRYKFLYDDPSHSQRQNVSIFEIPIQYEAGSNFKYKISRKSDPFGEFYTPEITTDGKIIIDYSQYKDEVNKPVEAGLNYKFTTVSKFSFPQGVFEDLDDNQVVTRPINDSSITGLKLTRRKEGDDTYYDFYLSSTGVNNTGATYDGIYRITFNVDRYNTTNKTGIVGYVMTGIKTGDVSTNVLVNLGINSGVYPRVIDTQRYQTSDILNLANLEELIVNEESAQALASDTDFENETNLAKNLQDNIKKNVDFLNELLKDEPQNPTQNTTSDQVLRGQIDSLENSNLDSANQNQIIEKIALPKFTLPKQNVDKNYYNNYINSGEEYVAVPLANYTLQPSYVFYGDQYGQLGYYIEETEYSTYRIVVNSTSNGVYVSNTSVCKGDTAIYANMPYSEDVYFENGICTRIPEDGIIDKNNYATQDSWKNAVNYFYTKNYLSSVDVFPTSSDQDANLSISNAISKALQQIGSCTGDFLTENSNAKPILYLEREVYVEPYDKDQITLLNNTLNSGSFVSPSGELVRQQEEKLYCVQIFDTSFAKDNSSFFKAANDYEESLTFKSFAPYKDSAGKDIVSYGVGENFGTVYYNDQNKDEQDIYRLEYVTGQAFSYNKTSNFRAWNGLGSQTISISNQNDKNYGYHLYGYENADDVLTFVKSNILNGVDVSPTSFTNYVVLKFNKQGFTDSSYIFNDSNGTNYTAINTSVVDSSGALLSSSYVFFNIQKYSYLARAVTENNVWYTNKLIPINDDSYGAEDQFGLFAPRFFEDATQEAKSAAEQLFVFPNGPSTSKNYEGSPLVYDHLPSIPQGVLNNKLVITEERKNYNIINNDFILNFVLEGRLTKELGLNNVKNYKDSRRLKITRVRYNVYSKNLLIVGDAGFPYALALNTGWEYKLQYRKKGVGSAWKEMDSTSSFTNSKIANVSSFLNPYFYKFEDLITPNYLPTVGFLTNLPNFLDDSQYQFRIFKYEKFDSGSDSVDIIRKTNFLPIQVNWANDNKSSYFNIYQLDSGNNLKLIKTENQKSSSTFAIPSVKQQYFDLGLANFSKNGSGYYDIIVSGALPSTQVNTGLAGSVFIGNPTIGNSTADPSDQNDPSGPIIIDVINQTSNTSGYNSITGVTYAPLINFNNPESKNADFSINANYSGYYFISDGKNATLDNSLVNGFECYVANTGSSTNIYSNGSAYSLNNNKVAKVILPSVTTTDSIRALPSAQVSVDYTNNYVYIKENFNYNTGDFEASAGTKSSISTIINGSSSSVTLTYGTGTISIPANTSYKLQFDNGWDGSAFASQILQLNSYKNVDTQASYINSSGGLVNLNYDSLILNTQDYIDLPIYNFAKNKLSVNGLINLNADSFYLLSGNPAGTITATEKDYFDSIKIYLDGSEGENNIFVLKDDTDIDVSYFQFGNRKEYYFIKDNNIQRSLNIKIKNGTSEKLIPKGSPDFKLTVKKDTFSNITYEILFPSSDFTTLIGDELEQLIVIKSQNSHIIDLGYIEGSLKSNAFVYFVNSSNTNVDFQRDFKSVMTLSNGEIAKVTLEKYNLTARITKINEARNHFEFKIDPQIHLTEPSGVNILNLNFCGADVVLPPPSDFSAKETFIISKNRLAANKIDYKKIENTPSTAISSEGKFSQNSIVCKIYKNSSSSTYPAVDQSEISAGYYSPFRERNTPKDDVYEVFYIKDADLKSFSIKDYFERSAYYYGKVLLESEKEFSIYSYDENNSNTQNVEKKGVSFDFDFDLGEVIDGALTTKLVENDYQIINSNSEDDGVQTLDNFSVGQYCINFAYDSVALTGQSVSLIKNRGAFINENQGLRVFPIYNEDEFFIAENINQELRSSYTNYRKEDGVKLYTSFFYQLNNSTDIESVFLPYSTDKKYIIENLSSRAFDIKTLDSNSLVTTIKPNEKKTFSYSSTSWISSNYIDSVDGYLPTDSSPSVIKSENQNNEKDSAHPFISLFGTANSLDGIKGNIFESFCYDEAGTLKSSISLPNGEQSLTYNLIDCDEAKNNTTTSDGSSQYMFCYGRGGAKTISDTDFVLNDFYLFIKYGTSYIKNKQVGGKFLSRISSEGIDNPILTIIKRNHFDLLSLFISENGYATSLPRNLRSATPIPFYNELQTYYLPNLNITIQKTEEEVENPSLGSLWLGKKFVFINLVKVNSQAPNKIYNYTDETYTDLINTSGENSVAVFEVVYDGTNYLWKKQTLNVPKIQNVYVSLKNVKGLDSTSSSNVTDGREMVYLSNFRTFNVSIDSFADYKFNNFYLYNSCNYPLEILFNGSRSSLDANSPFVKVSYDGSFIPKEISYNHTTNFVETESIDIRITSNTDTDTTLIERIAYIYPSPVIGAYAKLNYRTYSTSAGITTYSDLSSALFVSSSNGWSKINLSDYLSDNYCDLNVSNLEKYSPDSRLFIYGSSVRNQYSQSFDTYTLRVVAPESRSTSFFIFNNTVNDLKIKFVTSNFTDFGGIGRLTINLAKNRISKVYKNSNGKLSFEVLEIHQRGRYYLSNKNKNINYINGSEIELFIDACVPSDLDSQPFEISNDNINCFLTLLPTSSEYTRIFYNLYQGANGNLVKNRDTKGDSVNNFSVVPFDTSQSLGWLSLNNSQDYQKDLITPFLDISVAGHYILTNYNYSVKITPSASDIFLVNNTSKNIKVQQGDSDYQLYRNTVLIVNSTSKRYLKKGKRKDAFYSVFNPKTLVNTQREISLVLGIERHQEILPIYDIDFVDVPSYLKLYSRYGQTQSVYLNFQDYYLGKDIPSDCPENMLAYEVGTGHETIYKFLFFDPSTNYYTLPGITEGEEYLVDFNEGLFFNLLLGQGGDKFGSVMYMGKKYYNGQTFIGGASSWYEVDCPDYIKVQKITREIPLGFEDFYEPEKDSDITDSTAIVDLDQNIQLPDDPLALLKSNIFNFIGQTLASFPATQSSLCWIPENQNAFWLDSNFIKDIWEVEEIIPSDTKKITSGTQEVSFVKCKMKKIGSRFLINSFFFNFYSALQNKLKMSDDGQISMGFDYNLKPSQRKRLNDIGKYVYEQNDYIFSNKEFLLTPILKEYLVPIDSNSASVIKDAETEVIITIEKLKSMPELRIEDYSFDPTVTLLNSNKA
jgi:hypothetical protein